MPETGDSARSERFALLGPRLEQRRLEMDLRYRNLALFIRERGLESRRLADDIEKNRRQNYGRMVLMALSVAYGYAPNAILGFLDGDDDALEPVDSGPDQTEINKIVGELWGSLEGAPRHVQVVLSSTTISAADKLGLLREFITPQPAAPRQARRGA